MKRKIFLLCTLFLSLHFMNEFHEVKVQILTYSILLGHPFNFMDNINLFLIIVGTISALLGIIFYFINIKKDKTPTIVTILATLCCFVVAYLALYDIIYMINRTFAMYQMFGTCSYDYYLSPIFTFLKYIVYVYIFLRALISENEKIKTSPLIAITNGFILLIILLTLLVCFNQLFTYLPSMIETHTQNLEYIISISLTVITLLLLFICMHLFRIKTKNRVQKNVFFIAIIIFSIIAIIKPLVCYFTLNWLTYGIDNFYEYPFFVILSTVLFITTLRLTKKRD